MLTVASAHYFIMTFIVIDRYYGVNFMAPVPNNDHSVHGDSGDQGFLDYGCMFEQLRSKQWVLVPHAVTVSGESVARARANLFQVKGGKFAAPVVFGSGTNASVKLRGIGVGASTNGDGVSDLNVTVLHPGSSRATKTAYTTATVNGWVEVSVVVPLVRGCAMLLLG